MAYTLLDEEAPAQALPAKGRYRLLDEPAEPMKDPRAEAIKSVVAGAVSGASKIGSTILAPIDIARSAVAGEPLLTKNKERREGVQQALGQMADTKSGAFTAGELGTEIAGTAGIGGAIAKVPLIAKYAPRLAAAIESGGFKLGAAPADTAAGKAAELGIRTAGGAITGAATAGAVDPASAPAGAAIGAALPPAVKIAGEAGKALAPKVAPEVASLFQKAKEYGIDIPADRILNSRPLNAAAASLNYIPLSGRAATEEKMTAQLQRAVSRTFGQDSPNITGALRKAEQSLGDKFETTLKRNTVRADDQLLADLAANVEKANTELGKEEASRIGRLADEILSKVGDSGEINGQAAYNLKKMLDRIGGGNTEGAYYARELKDTLMDALDRSLGGEKAAEFKTLRQQFGNMRTIDKLAQNGADGGISVARLANLKDPRSQELQDLADIAAQFMKTREAPHGAAQRAFFSGGAIAGTAAAAIPGVMVAGRAANTALNSNLVKRAVLSNPRPDVRLNDLAEKLPLRALLYNSRSNQ